MARGFLRVFEIVEKFAKPTAIGLIFACNGYILVFGLIMTTAKKSSKQMDMLHGPIMKNIILFVLPLALGGICQQLFTSADMAVVYWFDADRTVAQAAVNSNGAIVNLLINLFAGLSVGATVAIAEQIGKKHTDDIHSMVFTAMVIATVSGVILIGIGVGVAEPILKVMGTPSNVLPLAVKYLRIYFCGMPFLMIYDFGAAILRSIGDTKKSLFILFVSGVLNVGLNILFVAVFDMSVAGVAIATIAANVLCATLVIVYLMKDKMLRFSFKRSKIRKEYVKRMFVIGLPAGLQGMVFSLANVFIQSAINSFGDAAMSGNGDAANFDIYIFYFVNAFGQATTTFLGQNYAAGNYDRCKKIYRTAMLSALVVSAVLSVIFVAGAPLFIRIYTTDPAAIEFALMRMWCVVSCTILTNTYETSGGALRGMGHSLLPAIFTVFGTCVLRIIWIYTVFAAVNEFWILMIVYPISWVITGAAVLISYHVISRREYRKPVAAAAENADTAHVVDTSPIVSTYVTETSEDAEAAAAADGSDAAGASSSAVGKPCSARCENKK